MSPHLIILINGAVNSGKDTVVNYIVEYLTAHPAEFRFITYSTIDTPRNFLATEYHIPPDRKSPEDRALLAGMAAVLDAHPDTPRLCELMSRMEALIHHPMQAPNQRAVLITHLREIWTTDLLLTKIRFAYGDQVKCVRVRVDRLSSTQALRSSNSADANARYAPADILIDNYGTLEELRKEVLSKLAFK